jgi:NTP pyrophosphatase (non-canonical NTP hydrolase)
LFFLLILTSKQEKKEQEEKEKEELKQQQQWNSLFSPLFILPMLKLEVGECWHQKN